MGVYEYPQVPRTSKTQLQDPPSQRIPPKDNRFSWVATPAEAKGRGWGSPEPQSEIPPLPQVPEYLDSTNHVNHAVRSNGRPEAGQDQLHVTTTQYSPQEHYSTALPSYAQPAPSYNYTPPQALEGHAVHHPQGPSIQLQQHPAHPQPTPLPATHQPEHQEQPPYEEDFKKDPDMAHTPVSHMSPPDSQAALDTRNGHPQQPQPAYSVAPDGNPLSHTSLPAQTLNCAGRTTTMPIIAPSDPDFIAMSNFSPARQPLRGGGWTHSLCSCSEVSICLPSVFCPCITYGKTQHRLNLRSNKEDPTNMLGYSACNTSCVAFGLLCGFNGILAAIQKTRIRRAYEMDRKMSGGVVDDCLRGVFCCCCSVAQDEKEVHYREEMPRKGNFGEPGSAVTASDGYASPGGMRFEAPPVR